MSLNDKILVKLNYFINKVIQFDDFQTLLKLEQVFQQNTFKK